MEASPNAFQRNKQPTPRRTAISEPSCGVDICKQWRCRCCIILWVENWRFSIKWYAKTLFSIMPCRLLYMTTQMYEIFFKLHWPKSGTTKFTFWIHFLFLALPLIAANLAEVSPIVLWTILQSAACLWSVPVYCHWSDSFLPWKYHSWCQTSACVLRNKSCHCTW